MNKQKLQFRQGDCLIESVENIPSSAKPVKSKTVAEGEGHHEHIVDNETQIMMDGEDMYLVVTEEGELRHVVKGTENKAEHDTIKLPAGKYKFIQQVEYDPYEDLIRQVMD